jgi:predicted RNase H-like HicB family nuclease
MKPSDRYHKWVEWSDEDQVYIGKCPDLISGIHGDDPPEVYRELREVVTEVIDHFESEGRPLPSRTSGRCGISREPRRPVARCPGKPEDGLSVSTMSIFRVASLDAALV